MATAAEDFAARFPDWDRDMAAYLAAREASNGVGWEHADCDHGNGYCCA